MPRTIATMFVKGILNNLTETKTVFWSRSVDDEHFRMEVLMRSVAANGEGSFGLGCGELAKAIGLTFDRQLWRAAQIQGLV